MEPKYKLLALDMDGTLLDHNNSIPASTVALIRKIAARGIPVLLASARPICAIMPYYQQLGLERYPMIALSGTCVLNPTTGEYFYQRTIPWQAYQKSAAVFLADDYYIKAYGENLFYINKVTAETLQFTKDFRVPYEVKVFQTEAEYPAVYRIFIPALSQAEKREKLGQLEGIAGVESIDLEDGIDVFPVNVDKGSGLTFFREHYGIKKEETLAIGNEGSDIPMLKAAGKGIVVANAREDLLQLADEVTTSNNEKGVEMALRSNGFDW